MSKRILIVEDQEDLRGVLRDLLSGSGNAVIEAVDGQDGVTKAKSERPDLVLMDIQLPVTSPGCSRARPSGACEPHCPTAAAFASKTIGLGVSTVHRLKRELLRRAG